MSAFKFFVFGHSTALAACGGFAVYWQDPWAMDCNVRLPVIVVPIAIEESGEASELHSEARK